MMGKTSGTKPRSRLRRVGVGFLSFILAAQTMAFATSASAAAPESAPVELLSQRPITSGAVLKEYEWRFDRKGKPVKVNAHVIEVDLQNPYVKLDTIAGTNGQFTKKQSVRDMANETGAVAAINGDFYNTQAEGVPMGPQIRDGQLLATPPYLVGWYSFALTKENRPVIDLFTFEGRIIAKDGASYPLGGINKTYYWFENDGVHEEGKHSHIDGLFMYTNTWGQVDRSNDGVTVPTEVLVRNGVVEKIVPNGIINMIAPPDGYILRASGKADEFVRTHLKVGDPVRADYRILPQDPNKSYDTANFKMMIGGHTILVDEGKPVPFSRDVSALEGYRSRTAIGYSKDGRYVYLITADHSDDSAGLLMSELQHLLVKVGVWKGMNLDGGGSTQMVARPLGETYVELVNTPEFGGERKVVNAVGVYSTAPKGQAKQLTIKGPTTLFLNEKAVYGIKGYDEYYNPIATDDVQAKWTTSQPVGTFEGNTFTATRSGRTTITATAGQATHSIDVEVVGRAQIAAMRINASSTALLPNTVVDVPVVVTTKSGVTRTVPPQSIEWELQGFEGRIEGNQLKVERIDPDTKVGRVFARYDGFTAMLTMPVVEQNVLFDFERETPIVFQGYPAEVTGSVARAVYAGAPSGRHALVLKYDFTRGTGTKAAYAAFGASGALIPGEPERLLVKVKGDNSYNWVRAEIVDAKGVKSLVDLTRQLNWDGWKTLSADLTKYNVAYPITLKRLYVANPENGQDERAMKGEIAFDDIAFQYRPAAEQPKNTVTLAIGKNKMTVNGATVTLDQAPVLLKDNTVVPIRFIIDALGGQLTWDDAERKVTVIKDNHMAEIWVDNPDLVIDGEVVTAEVAPVIMNERTMVPLRLISEKMGWTVTWDPETYSITLQ